LPPDNRELSLIRQHGSLAGRRETDFDFSQGPVAAHLRDSALSITLVTDDHALGKARYIAYRLGLQQLRPGFRYHAGIGPTLLGGLASRAPLVEAAQAVGRGAGNVDILNTFFGQFFEEHAGHGVQGLAAALSEPGVAEVKRF